MLTAAMGLPLSMILDEDGEPIDGKVYLETMLDRTFADSPPRMTAPTARGARDNVTTPPRVTVVMPGDVPALMAAMTAGDARAGEMVCGLGQAKVSATERLP